MTRHFRQGRIALVSKRACIAVGIPMAVITVLAVAGWGFQRIAEAADARRYPPPGRLVDIGGYRLHLLAGGEGRPTVVLEGGLAGPALQWALVQRELESFTTVVSYDRAGLGWSDPGPQPRTSLRMVRELHALLALADVPGPYVLVGHSLGGMNVRLFAHEYPKETLGLVLVASGNENDMREMPPEYGKIESANKSTDKLLAGLSTFGLVRIAGGGVLSGPLGGILSNFPAELQSELRAITFLKTQYWSTAYQELSGLDQSRQQLTGLGTLGDLPIVVVSASPDLSRLPKNFPVDQIRGTFRTLQDELSALSARSVRIDCPSCDHYVPMTDPAVVVQAVTRLLSMIP